MKIKKQDEQRMVIIPSSKTRFSVVLLSALLASGFGFCAYAFADYGDISRYIGAIGTFVVLTVASVLYGLEGLIGGNKVIIDKLTGSIRLSRRYLLLIERRRVISLSSTEKVTVNYSPIVTQQHRTDAWKVSLSGHEWVNIEHSRNKANMLYLASEISRFIGKELIDNSAKY